jgi:hypothetical protein
LSLAVADLEPSPDVIGWTRRGAAEATLNHFTGALSPVSVVRRTPLRPVDYVTMERTD